MRFMILISCSLCLIGLSSGKQDNYIDKQAGEFMQHIAKDIQQNDYDAFLAKIITEDELLGLFQQTKIDSTEIYGLNPERDKQEFLETRKRFYSRSSMIFRELATKALENKQEMTTISDLSVSVKTIHNVSSGNFEMTWEAPGKLIRLTIRNCVYTKNGWKMLRNEPVLQVLKKQPEEPESRQEDLQETGN